MIREPMCDVSGYLGRELICFKDIQGMLILSQDTMCGHNFSNLDT